MDSATNWQKGSRKTWPNSRNYNVLHPLIRKYTLCFLYHHNLQLEKCSDTILEETSTFFQPNSNKIKCKWLVRNNCICINPQNTEDPFFACMLRWWNTSKLTLAYGCSTEVQMNLWMGTFKDQVSKSKQINIIHNEKQFEKIIISISIGVWITKVYAFSKTDWTVYIRSAHFTLYICLHIYTYYTSIFKT